MQSRIRTRRAGELVTLLSCHVANAQKQLLRHTWALRTRWSRHRESSYLAMTWRQSHLCPKYHQLFVIARRSLREVVKRSLFPASFHSDARLCSSRVNTLTMLLPFPGITDDTINPGANQLANHHFLFISLALKTTSSPLWPTYLLSRY